MSGLSRRGVLRLLSGAPAAAYARVSLGGESVSLPSHELDALLQALATLGLRAAATVRDDIAALRLAGGAIHLLPTEAEREALRMAVVLAAAATPASASLLRLADLCDAAFVLA